MEKEINFYEPKYKENPDRLELRGFPPNDDVIFSVRFCPTLRSDNLYTQMKVRRHASDELEREREKY